MRAFINDTLKNALLTTSLLCGVLLNPIVMIDAQAEKIKVQVDRAKVMRISRPASTIIIGNPAIADATVQDATTLVLTGKSFGTTNMIILDADGEPIADEIVSVSAADDQLITVYKRTDRVSYNCTPVCERTMVLGDSAAAFAEVEAQVQTRNRSADAGSAR